MKALALPQGGARLRRARLESRAYKVVQQPPRLAGSQTPGALPTLLRANRQLASGTPSAPPGAGTAGLQPPLSLADEGEGAGVREELRTVAAPAVC